MKIAYISPFYYPSMGGIESFCQELAYKMINLGHEIHIITYTQYKKNKHTINNNIIHIHRIKSFINFYKAKLSLKIIKILNEINPDIIHIQAPAPLTSELILSLNRYNCIATWHNDLDITQKTSYKIAANVYKNTFFPFFYKKIKLIISPSYGHQNTSKFLTMVPPNKKLVIHNGVDIDFYKPSLNKKANRKKLQFNANRIGIFVGSMEKYHTYKGIPILLNALSHLSDLDLQFIFVGDGELRIVYEKMAKELIKNNKVHFTGRISKNKLLEYYKVSDFIVLPSIGTECFPIVILEAMACGLPVITSNLPGPSEAIINWKNGVLIKPNNINMLIKAITQLTNLKDEILNNMSKTCRNMAINNYSISMIAKKYMYQYKKIINNK